MQRRHVPKSEKHKAGEKSGAERVDEKSAGIDHEAENAGKAAALSVRKPRGVDFYHSRRAECLHVTVDPANQDEEPEQSPKRRDTENDVHDHSASRADEHRTFAAEMVGQQAIDDLTESISKQRGRDDRAHLRFVESKLVADRLVRDREIVATGVK